MNQGFASCHFDKNDMMELGKITNDLKKADGSNIFNDKYSHEIDELAEIMDHIDSEEVKCGVNAITKNKYDNFCKNDAQKKNLASTIDMIEKLIDKYGNDGKKIYDHYMTVLADLEKDCYKTNDPILTKQLQRIAQKKSELFGQCGQQKKSFFEKNYVIGWIIAVIAIVIIVCVYMFKK